MRPKTYLAALALAMVAGTAQAHVVKHRHHRHHHHAYRHQDTGAIQQQVTSAALRHGVPVALAHGIVRAESNYRCHVKASDGLSQGIMQVRPQTARSVGVYGSMNDCANSLEAGMRYLKQALIKAGGNWGWAATMYNRGIAAKATMSSYAARVLRLAHQ
jgi:soluble lytic murein transglycosylase-like protein